MCNVQCAMCNVQCAMCNVQCAMCDLSLSFYIFFCFLPSPPISCFWRLRLVPILYSLFCPCAHSHWESWSVFNNIENQFRFFCMHEREREITHYFDFYQSTFAHLNNIFCKTMTNLLIFSWHVLYSLAYSANTTQRRYIMWICNAGAEIRLYIL